MNRRQALSLLAASVALANGACSAPPNARIYPFVQMPEAQAVGTFIHYASAFVRDGYAQGVLIGTVEGRPIKIEGNPLHPSSLGATDVFTQASVLQLWDPDRSATVRQALGSVAAGTAPQAASSWSAFDTAWRQRAAALESDSGRGLHLLTGPLTSPTQRALMERLLARFPQARWHVHDPVRNTAARDGMRLAFGRELASRLHLQRTRCVLALAVDPFSDGPGAVRHAMDWSTARGQGLADGRLPRLFAAEVAPGLFGARADERLALPPHRIEALLWRLARHWWAGLPAPSPAEGAEAVFEARVLRALQEAGPDALVVAGHGLSADAHALALALNQRLGAAGRTLDFIEPADAAPQAGTLAELARALQAGAVDTLVVLDSNPAYDAPGALDFAQALRGARLSVHAGLYADETAVRCHWHLPLSHAYESWGDARAHDGSATLLQPAIAPLYDSRSAIELLALLAGDEERQGQALVRRQWRRGGDEAAFESFWRESLRRGVVADSAFAAVAVPAARLPQRPPAAPASALVGVFAADTSVHDGRFANLGWLQELPRPMTKLTWDNALLLGPRTAARLGLATGDLVRVEAVGRSLDAPVWISERHAEDTATLPLGYGRTQAGQVGSGVGFDAYALQPAQGGLPALSLHPLGQRHAFAVTQHQLGQAGRDIVRSVRAGERLPARERPPSLYPEVSYPQHAWAMVIDLDACIGCNACTIACQAENNIPVVGKEEVARGREMHWIRVDRYDDAGARGRDTAFQPLPCMHCEKAPCELVCPVGATVHDSEGVNVQVYNRCIGTRFCSNNCPYKVRRFNFLQFTDATTETLQAQRNPDVTVRQRGVMEKCSYCLQRISRARHRAEATGEPIRDGDVVTACQAACPTRSIHFGDLNDPASDVVRLKTLPRHYALLGELGTQPRTTYLARVVQPTDAMD
ncbi:4Fe-4S dicluster domain-containing protein [Azohydromonas lata]|uniref:4Fe-4S dicluster domain-containing protein n=1 Tax=Azohydromonas lata TaxID=45677 RepID=A0ABU5IE03_9BURK|nr:4Fe-4S dicluster domain-containing protein [Azohydromonas lata]MDZ5457345.1 4Fe-4S dicluster domain-containing protein [Azohydromonas lata]